MTNIAFAIVAYCLLLVVIRCEKVAKFLPKQRERRTPGNHCSSLSL